MKKLLLLLVMMLLPMVASADTVEIDGINYNLVSKGKFAEVTSNPDKYTGDVVIPESVTYEDTDYCVTSIEKKAFYSCSGLTSVTIPNTVTGIGSSAQGNKAFVKLKSGTTLTGVIKSIDPMDAVTIVIAGVETKIKMSDIEKIEDATEGANQNTAHVDKDDWRNMPFTANTVTQNLMNVAFDTNGPMGKCLFPQNESGNIIYSDIVESEFPADRIADLAKEFVNSVPKMYRADISDKLEGTTKVGCEVELKVGKRSISVGIFGDDNIGTWEKPASTVKFNLMIEIRNKKYRYSLYTFTTDRYRIPGEGKDKGPSNMIHWQRVNSLQKEMDDSRKSKKPEFQQMIDYENKLYQEEYNAVQNFLRGVTSFAKIGDDF